MAAVASPYGLRPYQLIGSQFNNTSAVREIAMTTNSSLNIFQGDVVVISGGQPNTITNTPGLITLTAGTTAGVLGVCAGFRYIDPTMKYQIHNNWLPANAITNGYTQVYIKVYEDPDALFVIQGNAQISGTLATALAVIGKNATLTYAVGSTVNGNSAVSLTTSTIATTNTFAVRIVDFYWGQSAIASAPLGNTSATDLFPDMIVKWNFGAHSYYLGLGN
jgi:hypothetical protein